MSFVSVLDDIGHGLKVFFVGATKVAVAAEPIVGVLFPGVAQLFNSIVTAAGLAEGAAAAAGVQAGTGPQKLAAVTMAVEGALNQYLVTNNIKTPLTLAETEAIVNAGVAFLNALPSPNAVPTPTV